jgi:hypothetical protein
LRQPRGQGGAADPDAGSGQQSGGVTGAPGAAGKRGNGAHATGAPINLPAYSEIGFATVDEERAKIENDIRGACKPRGELCVTTVLEARNGSDLHACFGGTKPDMSTEGRTYKFDPPAELVIYSEPGDCKATDPGVDQQTTDNSEPTITSEPTSTVPVEGSPPSSEGTVPPEGGQAQPTSTT